MKKMIWLGAFLILFAVFVLTACGTRESNDTEKDPATEEIDTNGEAAEKVEPTIEQVNDNTYRYTLVNQTEKAQLFEFTSSQRFDFSLTNDSGEVAFLFSSVSLYLQALGEETINQGDELSYDFEIPALELEPGTYKLAAWLTPKQGKMYEVTMDYVVK
ncbi:intracellular proteinase inhibitor (BsuPI) [Planococcus sp. ANT_H30]|uniref:Intracellular proteinase inhibitor (BsuPI) n=1 Tax=Planococcus kocurii TaxID=1374 RepID=A0ABM5WYS4_9BACL|nr:MULTISPECIES: BsuPI-related putative proteinase inhibitor [Planococcus]ALS79492.1 intracellular proteinase inhibitor (BsuPI) [Planococcus kocurii]KAA0956993.1 intracellular proteinase inhibitor (BsuPI) [Planococcus sp. ANT_H30]